MAAPALGELLATSARLTDVLGRENSALAAFRFADAASLTDSKGALAAAIQTQMAALKQQPDLLRGLAADERTRLAAAMQGLQRAALTNALALRAARDANHALFTAIADVVATRSAPPARYGRNAKTTSNRAAHRPTAVFRDARI